MMRVKFPQMWNKDPKVYIVVGGARNGTTFLARALQKTLVDLYGPGAYGRFQVEGDRISSINRYILNDAGGDMWQPPPHDQIMEAAEGRDVMMRKFLTDMRQDFWGFKDPRTSFTLPAWDKLFYHDEEDVYVIGIFRKRPRVMASLKKTRQGPDDSTREKMIIEYNKRTLENIARFLEIQ